MGPDTADTYAMLKPRDEWRPGVTTQSLFQEIGEEFEELPGIVTSLSQPIKFRMAEVLEGFMRFHLVVRFPSELRRDAEAPGALLVQTPGGANVPLGQLTTMVSEDGPAEVSRENGQRRVTVEANVRGRDLGSFVSEAQERVDREVFVTFNSIRQASLVFTGIPFAVTGGILALLLRGMNFSMSAGVGFVALFGVAVLNGVVIFRPVLRTATVASLGFIPMALSTGTGAEVQRFDLSVWRA